MANPNKVLLNNPFAPPTFQYPLDLGTVGQEPYIIFQVRDSVARNAATKGTIAMYMPKTLKVNYVANYDEEAMHVDQLEAFGGDVANLLRGGAFNKEDAIFAGSLLIDANTGANSLSYAERAFRKIINPHMALLFRGVKPRTFTFDFQMFAKNPQESEHIRNIIHVFKYAMHPATKNGGDDSGKRFFYYPENFVIGLFSPEDRYLFKISVCSLTSMEVDYAGSQVPTFFYANGAPVHITMSLNFTEHEIMTKERIAQGF